MCDKCYVLVAEMPCLVGIEAFLPHISDLPQELPVYLSDTGEKKKEKCVAEDSSLYFPLCHP